MQTWVDNETWRAPVRLDIVIEDEPTEAATQVRTLRDWYLSHLENNDDGSGLISTIAIRDATLNGLGVHLLISFMTRKLGFLLWQATSSMTE
jgi:hypothetical protein